MFGERCWLTYICNRKQCRNRLNASVISSDYLSLFHSIRVYTTGVSTQFPIVFRHKTNVLLYIIYEALAWHWRLSHTAICVTLWGGNGASRRELLQGPFRKTDESSAADNLRMSLPLWKVAGKPECFNTKLKKKTMTSFYFAYSFTYFVFQTERGMWVPMRDNKE